MPIFEVWSLDEGESVNYCFYSDTGDAQFYDHPNDDKLAATDYNDHIHFDPDDGFVASGHTGNQYGDAWKLDEKPVGFVKYSGASDVQLIYDGNDVTDELLEEGVPDFIDVEGLKEWVVGTYSDVVFDDGSGGGGGDDGDGGDGGGGGGGDTTNIIEDWESKDLSNYNIIGDNDAHWLFTDTSGRGDQIGGLHNYDRTVSESDADETVSTADEFESVLGDTDRDDQIIYITNDIDISSKDYPITIDSEITVAGDRGIDGSPGPLIRSNKTENDHIIVNADNVRLTGWRLEGNVLDWEADSNYDSHTRGILPQGSNVEIDNMEVYGFGYANILSGSPGAHIHHCNIHHGPVDGWGYGIDTKKDETIEYNRISFCRHMIAEENGAWGSYKATDNIFEPPSGGVTTDAHTGGENIEVMHNDYVCYDPDHAPSWANHDTYMGGHQIRDVPRDEHVVLSNWFANSDAPEANPSGGFSFHAIYPAQDTDDWTNITYQPGGSYPDAEPNTYDFANYPTDGAGCRDGTTAAPGSTTALKSYQQGDYQQIQSTSGLDQYPQKGDTFEFHFLKSGNLVNWQAAFLFGVQDDSTLTGHYEVDMNNDGASLQLDEAGTSSGDDFTLGSTSIDFQPNTAYKGRIEWPTDPANNGISIDFFNVSGGSSNLVGGFTADPDDTYTSGGIGFFTNFFGTTYFDTVQFVN